MFCIYPSLFMIQLYWQLVMTFSQPTIHNSYLTTYTSHLTPHNPQLIYIPIILVLSIITYQDFKERKISWVTLPVLSCLFIAETLISAPLLQLYFIQLGSNLLFILIQLSTLFIYFSLKAGKFINIINSKIGIGDILFFVTIAFAFSTINFILFYVGSLLFITILFLVLKLLFKNVSVEIPLAGAMAALLIIWYLLKMTHPSSQFFFESLFLQL